MIFYLSDRHITFPQPELAEKDGLLAIGGDLSVKRLLKAYSQGIFPWYSEETPILWYSPHSRFVIFPDRIRISKSMRKILRSDKFEITVNRSFKEVIEACAEVPRQGQSGTWITSEMQQAYIRLHKMGHAQSVEVWESGKLVGGLYGVVVNKVFCGESMFSKVSNASKCALIWLCENCDYRLIDCQIHNVHLEGLGAEYISREAYMKYIQDPD